MTNLYLSLLFTLLFICPSKSLANFSQKFTSASIGLGSYTLMVGQVQKEDSDSANKFEFNPYITFSTNFKAFDKYQNFSLQPQIDLGLPEDTRDSAISKWHYKTLLWANYQFDTLNFKFGAGLSMTQISSDGGSQTLNNFGSSDSFPLPDGKQTSVNSIIGTAVEYFPSKNISGQIELFAFDLLTSESRSFSYSINVKYHFDLSSNRLKKRTKKNISKELRKLLE